MAAQIPAPLKAFLEKVNFAVLATQAPSGALQATPMWFLHEDGHILINTSAGRAKLRNMQAHPQVALAIVDRENPYRYVQIRGSVVKFDRENGAKDIDRLSQRYHGRPYQYPPTDNPKKRVSIHIEVERVTAMGL
ncbi:MAG TPA: PPOX class F420-dependent oxidoreductase [bacterium]|nr:PPOX class F420-dependent oxidoreductase [bacterium]